MCERLVLCGDAESDGKQDGSFLRLALAGSRANVHLRLHDISRRMVADVPDLVTDLVEIATYVLCADAAVSRGGEARTGMGEDWRRRFRLIVPVRRPDRWSAPEVADALAELLDFMSEDAFKFEFTAQRDPQPFKSYLDLRDEASETFETEEVVLFSGGMDSLAGAIEELETQRHRVLLVSQNSSSKVFARQKFLAGELRQRFPGMVLHVPVHVTKGEEVRTVEYT